MIRTGLALALLTASVAASAIDIVEQPIDILAAEMVAGRTSAVALLKAYEARIAKVDPKLHAVLAVDPDALAQARTLDAERKGGKLRGPLHGIPILLKDNIESAGKLPTTAGSLALARNFTGRDAPMVARLRAAGAIILGKTNLSEWANFRSYRSSSGWSAAGGLTRNPYALDRNPCGSSAGSGAAAAASLAAATIGTETDGSIVCPSSVSGLVGLKPTVGLVSRTHIIPISARQDTAGPMGRSVRDVALLLGAMAGTDPADPATAQADARTADYLAALDAGALRGKRIGVMRFAAGFNPAVDALFDAAIADVKAQGAEIVEIAAFDLKPIRALTRDLLSIEFKAGVNAYFASTDPKAVPTRDLAALIDFNRAHADAEMPWFAQEIFTYAQGMKGIDDPTYLKDAATATRLAGPEGIDALLAKDRLDVLIAPTNPPAWPTDLINNGSPSGGGASTLPAVAGYPHLTVPMGLVKGLPVGLSFIGPAWSEAKLLAIGYAYEQATRRREPPLYLPSIP